MIPSLLKISVGTDAAASLLGVSLAQVWIAQLALVLNLV